MGASRLWWKRFVEKVSFESGINVDADGAVGDGGCLETRPTVWTAPQEELRSTASTFPDVLNIMNQKKLYDELTQ